jgi:hypothetical protein
LPDGELDLLIDDVLALDAGEDVLQEELELAHIGKGQLRQRVYSDRLYQ